VVIDNPKGYRQYGSDVAAPVFKEIADKIYASNLRMHPPMPDKFYVDESTFPVIRSGNLEDLTMICDQLGVSNHIKSGEKWVKTKTASNYVNWISNDPKAGIVPDVVGMTLRDAIYILENQGLEVRFNGAGRVVKQSEMPGRKAVKGSKIYLELG
jgi:cell division protein FtsI (penicillin-binding protein 3)